MAMQKLQATRIHTGVQWAEGDLVLIASEDGTIIDLVPLSEAGDGVQVLEGVLCPGFVNAHCHLELSHLKGHIPPQTGMVNFLQQVMQLRRFRMEEKRQAMEAALAEMVGNGVVATGDISNTTDSIATKQGSSIYFHNFIEITGFVPGTAEQRWQDGLAVAAAFTEAFGADRVTITPHAPYSVSLPLFKQCIAAAAGQVLSLHLMESEEEIAFFNEKQGDFNRLYAQLGVHIDFFKPTGSNSLRYLWPTLQPHGRWLWVHNTETSLHDLQWLDAHGANWSNLFFCLCPAANQYINMATPALHRYRQQYPLQLCLGTDSLAGNYYLNPMYEMRLLQKHGKLKDLGYLLQMATLNGARALGIDQRFGSFEPGKKPGILLLKGLEGDTILPKSAVQVIAGA